MAIKTCTGTTSQPFVHVQARLSQPCTITATGADAPALTNATGDVNGAYSITLQANGDLTPNPTFYTVTEYLGSTDNTFTVIVPQTAGPFTMANITQVAPAAALGGTLATINAAGDGAFRSLTVSSSSPNTPNANAVANNGIATPWIEGRLYSDAFAAGTVAAPTQIPAISDLDSGGTVAANTYKAEVTFVGVTGETTASPTTLAVTAVGGLSQLLITPEEAPAGATGFHVYIQTGGAGSYFLADGGVATALGTTFVASTTPATSGATPPVSNTASAVIAGAKAAMPSTGLWVIPNTLGGLAVAGAPGDPAVNQGVVDDRAGGAFAVRTNVGIPQKQASFSQPTLNAGYLEFLVPTQLGIGQQVQGLQVDVQTGNGIWGGGPTGGGSANTFATGQLVGGFFGAYRFGTRTELVMGLNPLIYVENANAPAYGIEASLFNKIGADAPAGGNINYGVGFHAWEASGNLASQAFLVGRNGSAAGSGWLYGFDIASGAASFGLRVLAATTNAVYLVPPADDSAILVRGRNAADNADVWTVDDQGHAVFPTLKTKGGSLYALSTIGLTAGGFSGAALLIGSGPNQSIYFGSGAPTITAPKGSLYLRSDGSTTTSRAYINTDGGTTWTALTTVA